MLTFLIPPSLPCRPPPSPRSTIRASISPLILGFNQYTHDTSLAVLDSTGAVRYALSKERLTRHKHDAGCATHLVNQALSVLSAQDNQPIDHILSRLRLVVANNHHFRIKPFEARIPFQSSLAYIPPSYASPFNLIAAPCPHPNPLAPHATKVELSHHLAHAFSAVFSAPFNHGIVLIMDGMGDQLDEWLKPSDPSFFHELNLPICEDHPAFRQFPPDLHTRPGVSFREAETAYVFERHPQFPFRIRFKRLFKRWTPENAPPELTNHSFEEMESVGAMYSRVSAIVFRDWNACGKVMGLAPWANDRRMKEVNGRKKFFFDGNLFDGTLSVKGGQKEGLENLKHCIVDPDCPDDIRENFQDLAWNVQKDLEEIVETFVSDLQEMTGERNVVFAGGVALNSTVNGVLKSSHNIDHLFVPPYPGDEGIAIGCAAFGLSHLMPDAMPTIRQSYVMPYFGKMYSKEEIRLALEQFEPWIVWEHADEIVETAQMLAESKVVGWFRGRSEFGPRALGNRSLLADPRDKCMVDHVNGVVKKRESFRPFAPSVLAEAVPEWFPDCDMDASPFMSITTRSGKPSLIEAVVHVDGTSRLQTVRKEHNLGYYGMICEFAKVTGVPMVMNTSFNVAGEPIVESPSDALRTFLNADGIDMLAFPGVTVRRRSDSDFKRMDTVCTACVSFQSEQVQDEAGTSLRTSVRYFPRFFVDEVCESESARERCVELTDALELEILEVVHERESCAVSEILELCGGDEGEYDEGRPGDEDVMERICNLYRNQLIFGC